MGAKNGLFILIFFQFFKNMPKEFEEMCIRDRTTTEQAIQILEELQGRGITNIQLKYSGWMNGGLRQDLPASLKVESAVGGKKGLTALRDYTRRTNVGLYPAVNFLTTPPQAKGFNVFRMAAMQIDQKDAKAYYYDMVTRTGEDYDSILSPAALGGVAQSFNKAYGALGISGLCLNDMGENLYADYTKGCLLYTSYSTAFLFQ